MSSLESVWEYREDSLYPRLFGTLSRGIFTLDAEAFTRLSPGPVDPRWLRLGVLEYAPNDKRNSWLYVTSGGSTPWDADPAQYDREAFSWLGAEYVLETPAQADWPVHILHWLLAGHVLASQGRAGNVVPDFGHRIALGLPIDGKASALDHIALCLPSHYPSQCQLDSGKFDFLHVLGITEAERNLGEAYGTARLAQLLEEKGAAPVTDPTRAGITI